MNNDQKFIFVTGFGPFVGHEEVNASWEAVKRLPDELDQRYLLKKLEVPVTYKDVDKIVEDIWKQKPYLVVHVGVHGRASRIHIENLAYNHKFDKVDFARKKLDCPTACLKNNDSTCVQINTKLDTDRIANLINELKGCGCNVDTPQFCCTSSDVGNYLCGYIYLKSLDHDPERSLFLHVPVMKVFSSEETSHCILEIIKECINQLEAKNTDNKQQEISL